MQTMPILTPLHLRKSSLLLAAWLGLWPLEEAQAETNTALGERALQSITGYFNTTLGYNTLSYNTGSGFYALALNTTGSFNTISGSLALYSNTTGSKNIASGDQALYTCRTPKRRTENQSQLSF